MSHEAVTWAQDRAPMLLTDKGHPDTTSRHVLGVLAEHARKDGSNAHPSLARIQYRTGFNRRTIQRALDRLRAAGLIEETGTTANGVPIWKLALHLERPASDWEEILADLEQERAAMADRQRRARAKRVTHSASVTEGVAEGGVTDSASGCHAVEQRDVTDSASGCHVRKTAVTVIDPSAEPSENQAVADAVGNSAGGFARAAQRDGAAGQTGEAGSGCAASDNDHPQQQPAKSPRPKTVTTRPRREAPGFDMVRGAVPAAVAKPGTRLFPGLHRAIDDLLTGDVAAGIPRRSPEQVIARMNRRWFGERAEERSAPDYRGCERCTASGCEAARRSEANPYGCDRIINRNSWLAAALLEQDCPDPGCEDGWLLGGGPCRACQARHEERRAAKATAEAAATQWQGEADAKAADTALADWERDQAAEEKRVRAILGESGAWGDLLDFRVERHMNGWRDKHPKPATTAQPAAAPAAEPVMWQPPAAWDDEDTTVPEPQTAPGRFAEAEDEYSLWELTCEQPAQEQHDTPAAAPSRPLAPVPGQGKPVQSPRGQRPLTMSLLSGGLTEEPATAAPGDERNDGLAAAR